MESPITYYLPKKVLKISFQLTVLEQKTTYVSNEIKVEPTAAYIRGDVKIASLLVPDEAKGMFTYEAAKTGFLSKTTMGVEYDPDAAGILLSINSQNTNLIGEVIGATIDLASSVAKLIAVAAEDSGSTASAIKSVEFIERQLGVVEYIDPTPGGTTTIGLPQLGINLPTVKVQFDKITGATYVDNSALTSAEKDNKHIWVFLPKPLKVKVVVEDNSYIKQQTLAEEYIYFPQFGELHPHTLEQKSWWFGESMNTTLTFSNTTGGLQKSVVTTESNVKTLLADAKKAADARKAYLDDQKKAKTEKKK